MYPKRDARRVSDLIQETKDWLCNRCIAQVVGTSERQVGEVTRHLRYAHRYYVRATAEECSSCGTSHLCIRTLEA